MDTLLQTESFAAINDELLFTDPPAWEKSWTEWTDNAKAILRRNNVSFNEAHISVRAVEHYAAIYGPHQTDDVIETVVRCFSLPEADPAQLRMAFTFLYEAERRILVGYFNLADDEPKIATAAKQRVRSYYLRREV
jgi:hypothetical protein